MTKELPLQTEVPIYDADSGITFRNAQHAADHFKVTRTTILAYANKRIKNPTKTFKLSFMVPCKKRDGSRHRSW